MPPRATRFMAISMTDDIPGAVTEEPESRTIASPASVRPPTPDLRPWFLTLADIPAPPLELARMFGGNQPVEVEVGSGRGLFLGNAGTTRPGTNFLGIEYAFK